MAENGSGVAYYSTIAAAEQVITDAGYVRKRVPGSGGKWVDKQTGKTAQVMRDAPGQFYVQWN